MGTERKIIAITGGIGSGKSVVSALLRVMGYEVYDCDAGAKRVMTQDEQLRQELIGIFGEKAFVQGELNRTYLSAQIFSDPTLLQRMNACVHPAVARDLMAHVETQGDRGGSVEPPFFFESAILFESGFDGLVTPNEVWTVSAPLELRIERAMQRDGATRQKVMSRIASQLPQEEKERRADYVIVNDGRKSLIEQVRALLR